MTEPYERQQPDYADYLDRLVVEQAEPAYESGALMVVEDKVAEVG